MRIVIEAQEAIIGADRPGNENYALREALVEARKVIKAMGGYWAMITLPIIDAALSAPPRNCDRFANSRDAIAAFENEIDYLKEGGANYGDLAAWLFSKAEGGAE